jgi:hypothetical protein
MKTTATCVRKAGSRLRPGLIRIVACRFRDERGQAIVEFALIVPILLLAVFGIVTFGRAMNYDEQETHLVNEAARFASVAQVPPGSSGLSLGAWLRSQTDTTELRTGNSGSVRAAPTVCLTFPNGTENVGDPVKVTMSFVFFWTPLKLTTTSTTIMRSATMRIEVPPNTTPASATFFAATCS